MQPIFTTPLLGLALVFSVVAQERGEPAQPELPRPALTRAQQEAVAELNKAVSAYREGRFADAQLHAEKALALDSSSKTAPLFIARTVYAQYKPGEQDNGNLAKAREAIDAYKRILSQDSQNEEAFKAIAYLYGELKQTELLRGWLFQRAIDPAFSDEKRAEAYVALASKDWACSFGVTDLTAHKTTSVIKNRGEVHYVKPKNPAEFEKAQRCANDGLEMIEAAIALSPDSEIAWSYKTNLLLELAKLSEMDHDLPLQTEYTNQANAARRTTDEITKRKATGPTTKP